MPSSVASSGRVSLASALSLMGVEMLPELVSSANQFSDFPMLHPFKGQIASVRLGRMYPTYWSCTGLDLVSRVLAPPPPPGRAATVLDGAQSHV